MSPAAGLDGMTGTLPHAVPAGAPAAPAPPEPGQVLDFMQRHIDRALSQRVRYRYVQPRVICEDSGYRIESPCCSRNVDPAGGVIDIALLVSHALDAAAHPGDGATAEPVAGTAGWCLFSRDHAAGRWVLQQSGARLEELMDVLCVDAQRVFWP